MSASVPCHTSALSAIVLHQPPATSHQPPATYWIPISESHDFYGNAIGEAVLEYADETPDIRRRLVGAADHRSRGLRAGRASLGGHLGDVAGRARAGSARAS